MKIRWDLLRNPVFDGLLIYSLSWQALGAELPKTPPSSKICEYLIANEIVWAEKLYATDAFKALNIDPSRINSVTFEALQSTSAGELGLAKIYTQDHLWVIFAVRLSVRQEVEMARVIHQEQGRFTTNIKFLLVELGLVAQEVSALDAPLVNGSLPNKRFADLTLHRSPFAVSHNGEFLAQVRGKDSVQVHALSRPLSPWQFSLAESAPDTTDIWLADISDDGRLVSLIATDSRGVSTQVVLDSITQQAKFRDIFEEDGLPKVTLFGSSFSVTRRDRIDLFWQGTFSGSHPISSSGQWGSYGLTMMNAVNGAFLNPHHRSDEVVVFAHGPQPLRLNSNGFMKPFFDLREPEAQQKAEADLKDLLDHMASDLYHGFSDSDFHVSTAFSHAVQLRSSGSG